MVDLKYDWLPKEVKIQEYEDGISVNYNVTINYSTHVTEAKLKKDITRGLEKLLNPEK